MSRGKGTDARALREAKRERQTRTLAAAEQRHLRSELLGVVWDATKASLRADASPRS